MINNLKIILNKFSKNILGIKWYYYLIWIPFTMIILYFKIDETNYMINYASLFFLIYFIFFSSIILYFNNNSNKFYFLSKIGIVLNYLCILLIIVGVIYSIANISQETKEITTNDYNIVKVYDENENTKILDKFEELILSIIFLVLNPFLASYNFTKHTNKNKSIAKDIFKNYLVFLFIFLTFWNIIPKINKAVSDLESKNKES